MSDDSEKVTLIIKDASAEDRYLFNAACRSLGQNRGDAISKLMRHLAEETYGVGATEVIIEEFRRKQARKADETPALNNGITPPAEPDNPGY